LKIVSFWQDHLEICLERNVVKVWEVNLSGVKKRMEGRLGVEGGDDKIVSSLFN